MYTKDSTLFYRNTNTITFSAALVSIARKQKQPRCLSTDEWVMKYIYAAIKKTKLENLQVDEQL